MYLQEVKKVILLVKRRLYVQIKEFKNKTSSSGVMYKLSHILLKLIQGGGLYKFSRETTPKNYSRWVEGMFLIIICGNEWSKGTRMHAST